MSNPDEAGQRIEQWRKSWGLLTQSAIWVLGVLGGFLLPPPVGAGSEGAATWERLAQFVITVLVGLLVLAGRRWRQRKHGTTWISVSVASLIAAVAVFFVYQKLSQDWTADYAGDKVVIGSVLTEQGKKLATENPDLSTEQLIFDFAGHLEDMYTAESLRSRRLKLAGVYLSCLPLFTICLLSTVQAMSCFKERKSEGRKKR